MPEGRDESRAPGAGVPQGHIPGPPPDGPGEEEIDQILADSFPASDTPPWTLSVAEAGRALPPRK